MDKNKVGIIQEGYQPTNVRKSTIGEFGYKPLKPAPNDNPGNRSLPKGDFGSAPIPNKK